MVMSLENICQSEEWMDGWMERDVLFYFILESNPLDQCLGKLLKIAHEIKSSRRHFLLNTRCCDQNICFYLSIVSAFNSSSFYFSLNDVDTSSSEYMLLVHFLLYLQFGKSWPTMKKTHGTFSSLSHG